MIRILMELASQELMIVDPRQPMSKTAYILPFAFFWIYLAHTILWGWW